MKITTKKFLSKKPFYKKYLANRNTTQMQMDIILKLK